MISMSPRDTTQKCSKCGECVQKSLSVRTHICPYCGTGGDTAINGGSVSQGHVSAAQRRALNCPPLIQSAGSFIPLGARLRLRQVLYIRPYRSIILLAASRLPQTLLNEHECCPLRYVHMKRFKRSILRSLATSVSLQASG
jgi:hypothetical protein